MQFGDTVSKTNRLFAAVSSPSNLTEERERKSNLSVLSSLERSREGVKMPGKKVSTEIECWVGKQEVQI